MASEQVIQRAARLLAEAVRPPARVILFGSHVRGDEGPGSDLDLLVIERDVESRRAERVRLRRALRGLGVPVDLVVLSERHVERWASVEGTVIESALREGRVLVES